MVRETPLEKNDLLSFQYGAEVHLKREDLQIARSYKVRGALNKVKSLPQSEKGVVCASAGNHAQGLAYACKLLGVNGTIYMPTTTPGQKLRQVQLFGLDRVQVRLLGDNFDEAKAEAMAFARASGHAFVHPFDDAHVIEGQGTMGLEIMKAASAPIDYLILPIGGGGLAAGLCTVFGERSPATKIIGVEPEGAAGMKLSLERGKVTELPELDTFVDGAAVKQVGDLTFEAVQDRLDRVVEVPVGKVCSTILKLYNEQAIVVEPAGALSMAALDQLGEEIRGKHVVCVVSGSNNDMSRTAEIMERSQRHEGLKHYFRVNFPQRAGALKEFVLEVLGPEDDITHFEYSKKNNRERGPAIVGIQLSNKEEFPNLMDRLKGSKVEYEYLSEPWESFRL